MKKLDPEKLHRLHASQAVGKGGNSFDVGPVRWRGDGDAEGVREYKREMARRLVIAWNVCEGWPSDALEAGCLRDTDTAMRKLLSAIESHPVDSLPPNIVEATGKLRNRDVHQDLTGGRPHDCEPCIEREKQETMDERRRKVVVEDEQDDA
jgi:hypothetical protein